MDSDGGKRRARGGRRRGAPSALVTGTSAEFLGRKPHPRAVRARPLVFVLGPPGVGKTQVARRLAGDPHLELTDRELLDIVAARTKSRRWEPAVLHAAALVLDGPVLLGSRPGFARALAALLGLRARAGRRTVVTEAADRSPFGPLAENIDPEHRATVVLRFPVGRGRRRFALRVCDELGLDPALARGVKGLEPWSYESVRAALRAKQRDG